MSERNIHQRMHAVMQAVGYVQKEDKKVNNQYTFVSHDAVTAKIRPALIENGILAIARVVGHSQDGNRTEVDVEVDFVNIDKPEDKITVSSFGYGIDPQDKGPGKGVSYAVKYAYLKAFALETGDDPERDTIPHKPPSTVQSALQGETYTREQQEKCAKVAARLIELVADEATGQDRQYEILEEISGISNEEKLLLWDKLKSHSGVRARVKQATKVAA